MACPIDWRYSVSFLRATILDSRTSVSTCTLTVCGTRLVLFSPLSTDVAISSHSRSCQSCSGCTWTTGLSLQKTLTWTVCKIFTVKRLSALKLPDWHCSFRDSKVKYPHRSFSDEEQGSEIPDNSGIVAVMKQLLCCTVTCVYKKNLRIHGANF